MITKKRYIFFLLNVFICILLTGCIHDHPDGNGVDPSLLEADIELSINLNWGENETKPFYTTRGRNDEGTIGIIEVSRDGSLIGRDEFRISPEEMEEGLASHKLSFGVHALEYDIAVWMENPSEQNIKYKFDNSNLKNIHLFEESTFWENDRQCGYAHKHLDLTKFKGQWGIKINESLDLNHPGGRFKLIATDLRKFVVNEIESIEKGETYTLTIEFGGNIADTFNAYNGSVAKQGHSFTYTDNLTLNYSIFEETEIAAGYVLCDDEDTVTMTLTVHNSARMPVVKSSEFSFPVKRGMISIVKGEFLSEKVTNLISVDNVWEDEIFIDL